MVNIPYSNLDFAIIYALDQHLLECHNLTSFVVAVSVLVDLKAPITFPFSVCQDNLQVTQRRSAKKI